jgi:uncharacterized protein with HEPN domain
MAQHARHAQPHRSWLFRHHNLEVVWDTVKTALPELLKLPPVSANDTGGRQ